MRIDNLTTETEFLAALKLQADFYWSTVASKRQAVNEIIDRLRVERKTDRKADRWWHQYQNVRATMSETTQTVQAVRAFVREMETKHGLDGGGPYQDEPIGGKLLALKSELCADCAAAEKLNIDWKYATSEPKRFWQIVDHFTHDMRAGRAWITTLQGQVQNLPESAVRDDLELAFSKLQWRLVQACNCSAMVASREFQGRGKQADKDDGRVAFLTPEGLTCSVAELSPIKLCSSCRTKSAVKKIETEKALGKVVERRASRQPAGGF